VTKETTLMDLRDAEVDLENALMEWRDAGGPIFNVSQAIDQCIIRRVQMMTQASDAGESNGQE
jgi:hypothetical protein